MDKVVAMLLTLARDGFYGTIEIKFEAGKVVLLRKIQNIKVEEKVT
jgi:hypothetical protein